MLKTFTLGIDLASQAKSTALAIIGWGDGKATVEVLEKGTDGAGTPLHDKVLACAFEGQWGSFPAPSKVAIDAPLGWPRAFVQGVADPTNWPIGIDDERDSVLRRATDHWVHDTTAKQPLSVSSDKIAYPAMRAAGLLTHFARRTGLTPDRSGMAGLFCEAYPDPSIRCFGLWPEALPPRTSYKGREPLAIRAQLVHQLRDRAPWLDMSVEQHNRLVETDDHFDALICALVARACERGLTDAPPPEFEEDARLEGWIHLPAAGALDALV